MGLDNGAKSRARRKHRDKCETVKGNTMREKLERLWQEATVLGSSHGTCIMPEREAAVRVATYYRLGPSGLQEMHAERRRKPPVYDFQGKTLEPGRYVCDTVMPKHRNGTAKGWTPMRDQQRAPDDELVIIRGRKVSTPPPFKLDWPA